MTTIVDDILKGVDDAAPLSGEITETPTLNDLLEDYQKYRKGFDAALPDITPDSTGRQFKDALFLLPARYKLSVLEKFNQSLEKQEIDVLDPDEEQYKDYNKKLSKLIVYGFFVLAFVTIASVFILSILKRELPSGDVFRSIMETITEIIKVIAGI